MNLKYTWLPAATPDLADPLQIIKAQGSHLIDQTGSKIYDAISSWWCKPLGHCHSLITTSINEQLKFFEHHIPANTYNMVIEKLSYQLISLFSEMDKVVYASDGSSAVEIAMKLSYECRVIQNTPKRFKFIALRGAYHGETIFTLSVCGIKNYTGTYARILQKNYFIDQIPYVNSRSDPLWHNCNFNYNKFNELFARLAPHTTALIIEPIVQGAAGMKLISRDFLYKLIKLAKQYDIHVISDEIMVGLGRLGYYSATKDIIGIEPDFICFAKHLSAGSIPMSAVLVNHSVTDLFRMNNRKFLHSHTHSCNAIAANVALNYLQLLANSTILSDVLLTESSLVDLMQNLSAKFLFVLNPRAIGAIAACELNISEEILSNFFKLALNIGIYLRPIGNTLYVLPPIYQLTMDIEEISYKLNKALEAVEVLNSKSKS